jgi:hypothetical protein
MPRVPASWSAFPLLFDFTILDWFSRKVVGWQLSLRCRTQEWREALEEAVLREFPDGVPRASRAWGLIFFWTALVIFSFSGLTIGSVQGKYFQVEMLSPQYFKITPRVQGPVSSYLLGGKGSRQLITRQENGQTVIFVRVPQGAKLTIKVGEYNLRLWMKNASSFEVQEEFRPQKACPAGKEHI